MFRIGIFLMIITCLFFLCFGGFFLYRRLTKHTCNAFGVSYPRSVFDEGL